MSAQIRTDFSPYVLRIHIFGYSLPTANNQPLLSPLTPVNQAPSTLPTVVSCTAGISGLVSRPPKSLDAHPIRALNFPLQKIKPPVPRAWPLLSHSGRFDCRFGVWGPRSIRFWVLGDRVLSDLHYTIPVREHNSYNTLSCAI
jgi:hypothetical protein